MVSGSILKTRPNFSGRWKTGRKASPGMQVGRRPRHGALPRGQWAALGSRGKRSRGAYRVAGELDT